MSADSDSVERAVVLVRAMILAGIYFTFDAAVRGAIVIIHIRVPSLNIIIFSGSLPVFIFTRRSVVIHFFCSFIILIKVMCVICKH